MKLTSLFTTAIAVAGSVAALEHNSTTQATTVLTTVTAICYQYATPCPEPTVFKGPGNHTYTATTSSEYITVTDCPDKCTIIYAPEGPASVFPIGAYQTAESTPSVYPTGIPTGTGAAPYPTIISGGYAAPTGSSNPTHSPAVPSHPIPFTGGANTVAVSTAVTGLVVFATILIL